MNTFSSLIQGRSLALTLGLTLSFLSSAQARTISWGSDLDSVLLDSTGVQLGSDFTFELGTFGTFLPTDANRGQWLDHWKVFDRATAPAENGYSQVDGFISHSAVLEVDLTTSREDLPQVTFVVGEKAYVMAYDSTDFTTDGTELALVSHTDWTMPTSDTHSPNTRDWRINSASTVPYGGLNDVQGPGGETADPKVFTLQTHTEGEIEKPSTWVAWQSQNPLSGLSGTNSPAGNPDGDIWDNALEYALCLHPGSGLPSHGGFCVEAITSAQYDATFIRRSGGLTDVSYCIEARSSLPISAGDTWTLLAEIPGTGVAGTGATITDNGDGTETVRLADIETTSPLTAALGFVRLTVKLDDDGNAATAPIESSTMVQGWKLTEFTQHQCETFGYPWLKKETFSGSIASVAGNDVTVTGTPDLSTALAAGKSYYLEVVSGTDAGHRFDVVSASVAGVVTLASDSDVCAGPPYNTSTTVPDLATDRFIVREHHTIEGLFPVANFTPEGDPSAADRLLIFVGGATPWKVAYVDAPAAWKDEVSGATIGTDVLAPCQGYFVHPQATAGTTTVLAMGIVRENAFRCPLNGGYTLVPGGFPQEQSFTDRGLDNIMNTVDGSLDPAMSDQVHFWEGDGNSGAAYRESFACHFRLDGMVPGLPLFSQWADVEDVDLTDSSDTKLFDCDRSSFYYRVNTACEEGHKMPLKWTP